MPVPKIFIPDYPRLSLTTLDCVGPSAPFNSFSSFNLSSPGPLRGPTLVAPEHLGGGGPPYPLLPATPATTRINIGDFALPDPLHTDKHWSKPLFSDQKLKNP
jgi:hypothetical protein